MKLKSIFLGFGLILLGLVTPSSSFAQGMGQMMRPLPLDPTVRTGVLPNGITYYIKHNEKPKQRADFYIAQKVGSMQEEEPQRGLAHFLEHMAFNGTKNFPGKNLITYLQSLGCSFGADINAYTGFDQTVYTVMGAPTQREATVDSCLLVLHDWSHFLTLDNKEIDDERGVIHEEWRMRNSAGLRMLTQMLPILLKGSKYAERMPIGLMSIVDHFPYQVIKDYYHKWYRPDLQGIIVVGDINVDKVEAAMKKIFADIPAAPANKAERITFPLPQNDMPLVAVAKDKEATSTMINISWKDYKFTPEMANTIPGLVYSYATTVATSIFNERCEAISQEPNAPFMAAGSDYGKFVLGRIARTPEALSFIAIAKEGQYKNAMKALVEEIEKVKQYGFTNAEYDRARTRIMKAYQDQYNSRNDIRNQSIADDLVEVFCNHEPYLGPTNDYNMAKEIFPKISVEVINKIIQEILNQNGKNMVMYLTGPDKASAPLPDSTELLKEFNEYSKIPVKAYKDEVSNQQLMDKLPKPGKIVKTLKGSKYNVTELILSNGAKVYLKKTDFDENNISLEAVSKGGRLLYANNPKDIPSLKLLNKMMDIGGLGKFSALDLQKVLAGHSAYTSPSIGNIQDYMSAGCSKDDMKTMFQLLYLQFTQNRKDVKVYEMMKEQLLESLKTKDLNPKSSLQDSVAYAVYNNNPLQKPLTVEDVNNASYDRILQIYNERFGNAADFKFFIIGNFDEKEIIPFIEQYIASLPANKKVIDKQNIKAIPAIRKGNFTLKYKKDLDTPSATILDVVTGNLPYTHQNVIGFSVMGGVFEQMLLDEIREKEGGTYSPSGSASISEYPNGQCGIFAQFECAPQNADKLNNLVFEQINKMANEGINKKFFERTMKNIQKEHQEALRKNSYWLSHMIDYYVDNRDWVNDYDKVIARITPAYIQNLVKKVLKQNNKIIVQLSSTTTEVDGKTVEPTCKKDMKACCKEGKKCDKGMKACCKEGKKCDKDMKACCKEGKKCDKDMKTCCKEGKKCDKDMKACNKKDKKCCKEKKACCKKKKACCKKMAECEK